MESTQATEPSSQLEPNLQTVATTVAVAMADFKEGMRMQQENVEQHRQLSIRIGARTTQIIRFSLFSILVLGLAMFFLVYILMQDMHSMNKRMNEMSGHIAGMHAHFTAVASHTEQMNQSVQEMARYFPNMGGSMVNMDGYMASMSEDIRGLSGNVEKLQGDIYVMRQDMNNMSHQFVGVNQRLGSMGHNVHRMAAPMKMFPFGD